MYRLSPGHVDVWATRLDRPPPERERLARLLAGDEAARAARFAFERDRWRFTVARGVLREVLGAYLGREPRDIAFVYGEHGKPALAPPLDASGLEFNVSHSAEVALYAFALHRPVGVDVERMRDLDDLEALAERHFSPAERRALMALPEEDRRVGFYACWTRKEAFVKALGAGLSHPLDAFTVSLAPGEPPRLLDVRGGPAARWTIAAFDGEPDYAGAIAVEGGAVMRARGFWDEASAGGAGT